MNTIISQIKEVFSNANEVLNEQRKEEEKAKLGIARGGSAGAITGKGEALYTDCGRKAQARLLGVDSGKSQSDRAMFEGGFALENYIEKYLTVSKEVNEGRLKIKLKKQLEEFFKKAGVEFEKEAELLGKIGEVTVSGRADFRLTLDSETVGIEVKSMASPFSTIKQVKNKFPMIKHLVQSCTYMILWGEDQWLIAVGNVFNANERGFKVQSGLRWYRVYRYDGDPVFFNCENEQGETIVLPFTANDIVRYYAQLMQFTKEKSLMPMPTELELNIDTYNRCKYCPMEGACNEYELGTLTFDQWIERNRG